MKRFSTQGSETRLGREGETIRALAFGGGGFDTALQLGVTHALLVARARAPDLVVGVSTGAINAAALADVLSAPDGRDRAPQTEEQARVKLRAQSQRFRELFEIYETTPRELGLKLLPDTYQIDASRPLEAVKLPIHHVEERKSRDEALAARAGFIHLANQLLSLHLSVGSLARVVRRWLGVRASGQLTGLRRWLLLATESLRLWLVVGANLHRVAYLVVATMWTQWFVNPRRAPAASAGQIVYTSPLLQGGLKALGRAFSTITLAHAWTAPVALLSLLVYLLHEELGVASQWLLLGILVPIALVVLAVAHVHGRTQQVERGKGNHLMEVVFGSLIEGRGAAWRTFRVLFDLSAWSVFWFALLAPGLLLILLCLERWVSEAQRFPSDPLAWLVLYSVFGTLVWVFFATPFMLPALRKEILPSILKKNSIHRSLFDQHALREQFVRMFDPSYYRSEPDSEGPSSVEREEIDEIVERALDVSGSPAQGPTRPRFLRDFETSWPPIRVGVVAAELGKGRLELLYQDQPVVEALLGAMAKTPWFAPIQALAGRDGPSSESTATGPHDPEIELLVDGSDIANEPVWSAIDHLRRCIHPGVREIHIYGVSALPITEPALGSPATAGEQRDREETPEGDPYEELVRVATRALELQRFRDATLERRLSTLYSRVLPATPNAVMEGGGKVFLRSQIFPIEPTAPLGVNQKLLEEGDEAGRRRLIAETVADGCRLTLETIVSGAIESSFEEVSTRDRVEQPKAVRCGLVIEAHLRRQGHLDARATLPGSQPEAGPGLGEVCRHCRIRPEEGTAEYPGMVRLRRQASPSSADWPTYDRSGDVARARGGEGLEDSGESDSGAAPPTATASESKEEIPHSLKQLSQDGRWPRDSSVGPGKERPTVSFLFSGGVFRGVFQVGVLTALSELRLRPDIVAGASVGSIMGAMGAAAWAERQGAEVDLSATPQEREDQALRNRQLEMARVAGTFLAIDRLVLTDRFSDLVREFTIRAARTRASLRDFDRFLRQYDRGRSGRFSKEWRRVVASLERLFYVSPFELHDLVKSLRLQEFQEAIRLAGRYFQEVLDRYGSSDQILGAEPLELLIREHVIRPLGTARDHAAVDLEALQRTAGVLFLATATNLTLGRLEVLGSPLENGHASSDEGSRVDLVQALLASSAFPAVFRPRWSWEVRPATSAAHTYVDGGVMDNLPLDAVAQFLVHASTEETPVLSRRPILDPAGRRVKVPHLLVAASLQPDPPPWQLGSERAPGATLNNLAEQNLIEYTRRARRLKYNRKIDLFKKVQAEVRTIYETWPDADREIVPLDLEVVVVKPRWLCGTFAFHPMLGFRRELQAASIAHGCASTLLQLGWKCERHPQWRQGWGVREEDLPDRAPDRDPSEDRAQIADPYTECRVDLDEKALEEGRCWYRSGRRCPFHTGSTARWSLALGNRTRTELHRIWERCGRAETHAPRGTSEGRLVREARANQ